jgi:hypothetical protein
LANIEGIGQAIVHEILCVTAIHEGNKACGAPRDKVDVHEQTTADRMNDVGMHDTIRDTERDRAWVTVVDVSSAWICVTMVMASSTESLSIARSRGVRGILGA